MGGASTWRPGDRVGSFELLRQTDDFVAECRTWEAKCVVCGMPFTFSAHQLSKWKYTTEDCICAKRAKLIMAGRLGGLATARRVRDGKLPKDFYSRIGKKDEA